MHKNQYNFTIKMYPFDQYQSLQLRLEALLCNLQNLVKKNQGKKKLRT